MRANKFATVSNGVIVSVTDATPDHELQVNQFEVTPTEYWLLTRFLTKEELNKCLDAIEEKRIATVKAIHGIEQ